MYLQIVVVKNQLKMKSLINIRQKFLDNKEQYTMLSINLFTPIKQLIINYNIEIILKIQELNRNLRTEIKYKFSIRMFNQYKEIYIIINLIEYLIPENLM